MSLVLHGLPIGGGIAVGRAHILQQSMDDVPHYSIEEEQIEAEIARFDEAVKATRRQLEQLRNNIPENAPTELGAFISLHLMLVADVTISREPVDIIRARQVNAEWALRSQADHLTEQFDTIEDNYLRERKQDMLQVIERIFKNLRGRADEVVGGIDLLDDTVLIAEDLSPADTVHFKDERICAFVTDSGGSTSHTAILGRSMDIPSVISLHHARRLIREDEWVIVDGIDGVLIVRPDELVLEEYRRRIREYRSRKRKLNKLKNTAAVTADGVNIEILANIETLEDLAAAGKTAADGIGLFRSEFLFLNRDTLPDEEEQYQYYSKIAKKMNGKTAVIRTVDLGADKNPRWFGQTDCMNPALGLTGIRLCLAEPVMFRTQMRAILRAARHGPLAMMWPMITSLVELRQCQAHLKTVKQQLIERNEEFAEEIPTGIMIETPAAALAVGTLLKYIDFISIGTNDLIQYTLAVDRGDESVNYLYQPYHPVVLKLLSHIIRAAVRQNKPVSICGEMAGDPVLTRLLLGLGLRRFSMHPSGILPVKEIILGSDLTQLETAVNRMLRNEDPEKSEDMLKKINEIEAVPPQPADDAA